MDDIWKSKFLDINSKRISGIVNNSTTQKKHMDSFQNFIAKIKKALVCAFKSILRALNLHFLDEFG